MNGIILYGSRYGAARQYAQALEERTGLPAVSYAEVRDFGPFDTIVYVGGLYAGKTTGLAKTARRLPTRPSLPPVGGHRGPGGPGQRGQSALHSGVPGQGALPRHLCPDRSCPSAGGHRLPGAEHQAPADDEGALRHSPPPARDRTHPPTPRPCWTAMETPSVLSTLIPWPPLRPG